MFSFSNSSASSRNPNTSSIPPILAACLSPRFEPSSHNNYLCNLCFRAFPNVLALARHQNAHRHERNDILARVARMQQSVDNRVLTSPEVSVSWVHPAEGSNRGYKRQKVLKVMPSVELTLETGATPAILLEVDESDKRNDLELYLEL